jgi:hypothetical protein
MFFLIATILSVKWSRRDKTGEGRAEGGFYAIEAHPYACGGVSAVRGGESRGSLDSDGIRWPEKVVLRGEAREVREWTVEYGRQARGLFDCERVRSGSPDSRKREEG